MKTTCNYPKINLKNSLLAIGITTLLGVAGCEQKGPAEKAGEKIDQAAENAKQNIEQATDTANQKLKAAKESIEQKTDQAGVLIDNSTDASKAALEKTEQNIERFNESAEQKIEQVKENAGKELESAKAEVVNKAETAQSYVDDSVITLKVKAAILDNPALKDSQIEVSTVNGVVKLVGSVSSEQNKTNVIDLVKRQPDVSSVQAELMVNTAPAVSN